MRVRVSPAVLMKLLQLVIFLGCLLGCDERTVRWVNEPAYPSDAAVPQCPYSFRYISDRELEETENCETTVIRCANDAELCYCNIFDLPKHCCCVTGGPATTVDVDFIQQQYLMRELMRQQP